MNARTATRTTIYLVNAVLCLALSGVGCDSGGCKLSTSGSDWEARRKELEQQRRGDEWEGPRKAAEEQARQIVADRYRGRIVPGVGCDECPDYCALVDLREPDPEEFRQAFRKAAVERDSRDLLTQRINVYEHNRLTCILMMYDSMSDVLAPLLDARELPRVRFEAASIAIAFRLGAGDPGRALYELAEGSDHSAEMARRLMRVLDHKGWPELESGDEE